MGWLALRLPQASGGVAAQAATMAPLMEAVGVKIVADNPLRQPLQGGGEFVFTMTAARAGLSGPSSTSAPWPGWRHSVA